MGRSVQDERDLASHGTRTSPISREEGAEAVIVMLRPIAVFRRVGRADLRIGLIARYGRRLMPKLVPDHFEQ